MYYENLTRFNRKTNVIDNKVNNFGDRRYISSLKKDQIKLSIV
jgi:hypothetical protein